MVFVERYCHLLGLTFTRVASMTLYTVHLASYSSSQYLKFTNICKQLYNVSYMQHRYSFHYYLLIISTVFETYSVLLLRVNLQIFSLFYFYLYYLYFIVFSKQSRINSNQTYLFQTIQIAYNNGWKANCTTNQCTYQFHQYT